MILALHIKFDRPLFLLLLIAFLALTIIPYFTISKRYRKTRNRITSMVLHTIVSLMVVLILSGMIFVKTSANISNELILLVDVSSSEKDTETARDDFIKTVINRCRLDNVRMGIVTFGFDQEYAVPLTRDYDKAFDAYKAAAKPDVSATNIASSLLYAQELLTKPECSKIVLVTDGKETDENANAVIRRISSTGIKVDVANINSELGDEELQIIGVTLPDYHISIDDEFALSVDIHGNFSAPEEIQIRLIDNDLESDEIIETTISKGIYTYTFKHKFTTEGLHKLKVEVVDLEDNVIENNSYVSYYYLAVYNNILILEQKEGQSEILASILTETDSFKVKVLDIHGDELPKTLDELAEYDEVIMNNIANRDIPSEFVNILHEYVYTLGGGLFTTGGTDDTGEAHAYNRDDMIGSLYQKILPVQAINYTPPVGVIVIIDRSGSMGSMDDSGNSLLEWAKAGASSCLNALTERDYFGLMTLDTEHNTILELTKRSEESKIYSAIQSLDKATGGTSFKNAIDRAGQALRALKDVDKKHIIIVSDGQVPESEVEVYEGYAENFYNTDGISISVVGVDMSIPNGDYSGNVKDIETKSAYGKMLRLTRITNGTLYVVPKSQNDKLVSMMREDLNAPEIKEVNYEEYYPIMTKPTAPIFKEVERSEDSKNMNAMTVKLEGFYGVKVRSPEYVYLIGEYNVPIYAQWRYGEGTVGSLMVDVYGEWSGDLLEDDNGRRFIRNVVSTITPTEAIRSNELRVKLYEDNYTNTLGIYTTLNDGEKIVGNIKYNGSVLSLNSLPEVQDAQALRGLDCYVVNELSKDNNYSRAKFIIKTPGVYEIEILKYDKDDKLLGSNVIYKEFAYSKEYDVMTEEELDYEEVLENYALYGSGSLIKELKNPHEIIDTFNTVLSSTFDPRYLFAIIAIICFLLDIAVRKFKFKWPHEIIKQYKENKQMGKGDVK